MAQISVFSGTSHPLFAKEVATLLELPLGQISFEPFPDGEISIQILENVRGRDIFVIQTIAKDPNYYLVELLMMIDAFKRASARSISVVIPYFGYARQDRKDKPRVPITAKLIANLLTTAGANRIITMDLHAEQIQGFFDIPMDNLYARPVLIDALKQLNLKNIVMTAPDLGAIKKARNYAAVLNAEFALIDKRRIDKQKVEAESIIGEVKGKNVVLIDDLCSTGATLISAAEACKKAGALKIIAAFTHPLLAQGSIERLRESPIESIITTNTIPLPSTPLSSKMTQISVASLFAQAIRCIMAHDSISSIFI